ncbi:MAG: hypothetical protein HZA06_03020 [Nitrospirae bacterium]|nr:hypothetical protein [Nitrospirota bacterium]
MKIYLDTSVINIYLFGAYSEIEAKRVAPVNKLFELINAKQMHTIVSLYTLQEIYVFCKRIFSVQDAGQIAKLALSTLFDNEFELCGLLSREERLLYKPRFNLNDLSDQPHAISAYLNKCDAIATYDDHFQQIKDKINVYSPEEIISKS